MTADTLDFGACLFRCVLMGPLREHSFELKGYLLRTNIIPHFVVSYVRRAQLRCEFKSRHETALNISDSLTKRGDDE